MGKRLLGFRFIIYPKIKKNIIKIIVKTCAIKNEINPCIQNIKTSFDVTVNVLV